jgi:hypothetical protein
MLFRCDCDGLEYYKFYMCTVTKYTLKIIEICENKYEINT